MAETSMRDTEDMMVERRLHDQRQSDQIGALAVQVGSVSGKVDTIVNNQNSFGQKLAVMEANIEVRLRNVEMWQSNWTKSAVGITITILVALFFAIANGAGIHIAK